MNVNHDTPRSPSLQNAFDVADDSDLQGRRTRRALWQGLVELLVEKPLQDIRVSEITARASVHRVTFYKHFENKQDLLERGSYEIFSALAGRLDNPPASLQHTRSGAAPGNFVALFEYVQDNRRALSALLARDPAIGFEESLAAFFEDLARKRIADLSAAQEQEFPLRSGMPPDFVAAFSAGALVATIRWWLDADCRPQAEELARKIGSIFAGAFLQ